MSDERPVSATNRTAEVLRVAPRARHAYLVVLGEALERAARELRAIEGQCIALGLPTGWFDISDLELLEQRVTAELLNGPAPDVHRIALDLQDYATLVRGGEVQRAGARIVLRDIGWPLMLDEINNAALEAGRRVAREEDLRG